MAGVAGPLFTTDSTHVALSLTYDWSHAPLSLVTRRESVKGLLSCLHVAHHKHSHIGTVKSHINFEGILWYVRLSRSDVIVL